MNVVGHRHIADHHKLIALPDLLEDLQEQIAPARACQPGLAMITTTGEKMEIVVAGVAPETGGHIPTLFEGRGRGMERSKTKPRGFAFGNPTLAQNARVGHPRASILEGVARWWI